MTDLKPAKILAHVKCGTPPASVRTAKKWDAWRLAETERMVREAAEQIIAMLELQAGATRQ